MNSIRTRLTVAAGVVIIILTAAAFWLSYAHLHDVAATYGLGGSPERAWAWPATLDLFIVAGEVLMLVAALNGKRDPWAIGLTVTGSVGSIALNVLGVGGGADPLEYVVAAVPPAAALLAFGALMRQLHTWVAEPEAQAEAASAEAGAVQEAAEVATDLAIHPTPEPEEEPAVVVEPEEEEEPKPEEDTPDPAKVHHIGTRPSAEDIADAVNDITGAGEELTGAALAAYFGVSDRSGRRYLAAYQATA
ncbi:DUF2637 domain-containing protein [Streptomyces albidoflavus]|uniref:DUF2637 domain-containing protein n=1 Tax=Streptomyces albidoflavus TaxID=1886 RepID=UPI0033DB6818